MLDAGRAAAVAAPPRDSAATTAAPTCHFAATAVTASAGDLAATAIAAPAGDFTAATVAASAGDLATAAIAASAGDFTATAIAAPADRFGAGLALLRRRVAELPAGFFHDGFEVLASLLPGLRGQRNGTFPLSLTFIFTRMGPAASLAAALVVAVTRVLVGRRTVSRAGALVLPFRGAASPFPFAGIEPAANVRFFQQGVFLRLFVRGPRLPDQAASCDHPAKRSSRQRIEIATGQTLLAHNTCPHH